MVNNIEHPTNRSIPISVKNAIVIRSEKQCEYVGQNGVRCKERRNLEFEHIVPYSRGGGHTVSNCKLFCRNHNLRESIKIMPQQMKKYI